jgi:hypothetical protein
MPTAFYPSGLGGSAGSSVVTAEHVVASSSVVYVDPVNGSASNDGLSRATALASLDDVTFADGLTVVLMGDDNPTPGIASSVSSGIKITNSSVTIVGEGDSSPTISLGVAAAPIGFTVYGINVSGANVSFENLAFSFEELPGVEATSTYLYATGNGLTFRDCSFGSDDTWDVDVASTGTPITFIGCTFDSILTTSNGSRSLVFEDCSGPINCEASDIVLARDLTPSGAVGPLIQDLSLASTVAMTIAAEDGADVLLPQVHLLPRGLGDGYGSTWASCRPAAMTSLSVWFDSSVAAAGDGSKNSPYSSLSAGATSNNFLASGHNETLTATIAMSTGNILCGRGSGTSMSKLRWTPAVGTSASTIRCTDPGATAYIENVWFGGATESSFGYNGQVLMASATGLLVVRNCIFDCGAYDLSPGLYMGSSGAAFLRLEGCTFRSTATSASARPQYGLHVNASSAHVSLVDCTFDGGTYGFAGSSNGYAAHITASGVKIQGLRLLNNARIYVVSTAKGYVADDSADHAAAGIVW